MAKNKIKTQKREMLYVQLNDSDTALTAYSEALADTDAFKRTTAGAVGRTFEDYDGSISIKSSYHRGDYEWFRTADTIPREPKEIINTCNRAYERIGIVKQIIDLMSEFTTSGIRIQHSDKNIENFYNGWFRKVGGKDRSERFVNLLYRMGTIVIRRKLGTLTKTDLRNMKQARAKEEDEVTITSPKVYKRQIPLKYTFQNVANLEVINPEDSLMAGEPFQYGLNLSPTASIPQYGSIVLRGPRRTDEFYKKMPKDIRKAYKEGRKVAPLDMTKHRAFYYKKDDWQVWAKPMIYSVLADLIMYEKLKLADISALDGVISNVRLWRLGYINDSNPLYSILPTKVAINRLRSILHNNVGGGTLDLVWGPELDFKESSTDAWRWLGETKYGPTLDAVYDGLGIPPTLRSSDTGNNTGNFIGLQTLIERLEYGRQALLEFWDEEIRLVHNAMGFKTKPPKVIFDCMILADRAAERQLLINLADRDIISYQAVNEAFGYHPEIEAAKVKAEAKRRGSLSPEKASPYHNPDKKHEYKKLALQTGVATPSEIGLKLNPKKKGEMNRFEQQKKFAPKPQGYKPTGTPQEGRPKNVQETQKRKPKPTEKPSTNAFVNGLLWTTQANEMINKIVIPGVLKSFGKSNLRSLTKEEFNKYERIKFIVLCNLKPHSNVNKKTIVDILNNQPKMNTKILAISRQLQAQMGSKLKVDEIRQINVSAYITYYKEFFNGDN